MVAAGATVESDVTVHDPLSAGSAGPGLLVVGFDAETIRAAQARDGGLAPRLERVLDRAGEHPVRAASLSPKAVRRLIPRTSAQVTASPPVCGSVGPSA